MVAAYITTVICITILVIAYKSNFTIQYQKHLIVEQPMPAEHSVPVIEEQPNTQEIASIIQDVMFELGGEDR